MKRQLNLCICYYHFILYIEKLVVDNKELSNRFGVMYNIHMDLTIPVSAIWFCSNLCCWEKFQKKYFSLKQKYIYKPSLVIDSVIKLNIMVLPIIRDCK